MYALLAVEVLARHFASHNAQCYIDCMPAVVAAAAGKGGVALVESDALFGLLS
jgi:hypothetical protein